MNNQYIPFPRQENAVFVGDTAIEVLAAMRIYGRALIGGELPNMHYYHPQEKLLECTACFMHDQRVMTCAVGRADIDYVLLEDNAREDLNPADRAEVLREQGYEVKLLDVSQGPLQALREAGVLFGEQKRAERVIRQFLAQEKQLTARFEACVERKALIVLTIRNALTDALYHFALSENSELATGLLQEMRIKPINATGQCVIDGLIEVQDWTQVLAQNYDFIAICGDVSGGLMLLDSLRAHVHTPVYALPYYGNPLSVHRPQIMKQWFDVLDAFCAHH